jgi:multiple sugar transport system ATP-binding protein
MRHNHGNLHYGSSGTYLPVEGKGSDMATVTFEKATRIYPGTERPAVDTLDLHIEDGEFLVLVGPSGCGKSTSLRMLAGLEDVDAGSIRIGERDVTHIPPKDRDIAMVFQNYALYPHMTVADNMGFALKIAGVKKDEIRRRVGDAAKLLDLTEYLERKPKALSGGQRQRVAMGRAIVREPQVFLMDEPLSNLDAKLRVSTRTQIASLQRRLGITTVYVTHDQIEAMTMGDRVAVLKDGILQQVDTPLALYDKPSNVFVAGFIGSPAMNIGTFKLSDGHANLGGTRIPLSRETVEAVNAEGSNELILGFRPESLEPATQETHAAFPVIVDVVEELGSDAYLYGERIEHSVEDAGGSLQSETVIARVEPRSVPQKGETVYVKIKTGQEHAFSVKTGERLPA